MRLFRVLTYAQFACCLILAGSLELFAQRAGSVDMARQRIIAEKSNRHGVREVIAIDVDDVVHEIAFGLTKTIGPQVTGSLGVQVLKSGDLDLALVLPKEKVAVYARRVSLQDGSRIHVIVAWGFTSDDSPSLEPYFSLYIVKKREAKTETLVTNEDLGVYLEQIVVEDINGDGNTEVLVTGREASDESMYIYEIHPTGEVKYVQRIDADYVHTIADRFVDTGAGIYVQDRVQRPRRKSLCFDTAEYTWSSSQRKFVKMEHK